MGPDNQTTLERMKIEIVSTLIPFKDGASEVELCQAYYSLLGKRIAFEEAGFRSLRDLLRAMPLEKGSGKWKAIPDESTDHLARMISAQKSKTRKKKGGPPPRFARLPPRGRGRQFPDHESSLRSPFWKGRPQTDHASGPPRERQNNVGTGGSAASPHPSAAARKLGSPPVDSKPRSEVISERVPPPRDRESSTPGVCFVVADVAKNKRSAASSSASSSARRSRRSWAGASRKGASEKNGVAKLGALNGCFDVDHDHDDPLSLADAWVERVVDGMHADNLAEKSIGSKDHFKLAEDVIPLPTTVEAQTAWQIANILRDLPSGAPLDRLNDGYKRIFGRDPPLGAFKTLPRLLLAQKAEKPRFVFSLQLDGKYDVLLHPSRPGILEFDDGVPPLPPFPAFPSHGKLKSVLVETFRDILIPKFSPRISLFNFGEEYIWKTGEEIPLSGFNSVVDMLCSLFAEKPFEGLTLSLSSTICGGIVIRVEPAVESDDKEQEVARLSPADQLLFYLDAFDRLPAAYFPEFYFRQSGSNVPLSLWGFDNEEQLIEFVETTQRDRDVVKRVDVPPEVQNTTGKFVIDENNNMEWRPLCAPFAPTDDASVPDHHSPPRPLDNHIFDLPEAVPSSARGHSLYGIPEDAVIPGSDTFFPPAPFLEVGLRYSVYVSNVVDGPNLFFLQVVSGGRSQRFDQLMNEIAESYLTIENCKSHRIPEPLLFPGAICVAISLDNNFCRGRITDGPYVYNNKKYYKVFWVDYGGYDHVPDYAILFVKEPFRHLPVQAIPASLALGQMLPANGVCWSQEAKLFFFESVSNEEIWCEPQSALPPRYEVCLWNTSSTVDVIFPDEMVRRGYAVMEDGRTDVKRPAVHPSSSASFKRVDRDLPLPAIAGRFGLASGGAAEEPGRLAHQLDPAHVAVDVAQPIGLPDTKSPPLLPMPPPDAAVARVESIPIEEAGDVGRKALPTSFVLVHLNGKVPFVVEKQMAQLLFHRRDLPEVVFDAVKEGAVDINRDEHGLIFQDLLANDVPGSRFHHKLRLFRLDAFSSVVEIDDDSFELASSTSAIFARLRERLDKFLSSRRVLVDGEAGNSVASMDRPPKPSPRVDPELAVASASTGHPATTRVTTTSPPSSPPTDLAVVGLAQGGRGFPRPEGRGAEGNVNVNQKEKPIFTPPRRQPLRRASRPGAASGLFESARQQLLSKTPQYRDGDVQLPPPHSSIIASPQSSASSPSRLRDNPKSGALSTVPEEEAEEELADAEVANVMDPTGVSVPKAANNLYHTFPPQHHRPQQNQSNSPVAVVKPLPTNQSSQRSPTLMASSLPPVPRTRSASVSPLPANQATTQSSRMTRAVPSMTSIHHAASGSGSVCSPEAASRRSTTPPSNLPLVSNLSTHDCAFSSPTPPFTKQQQQQPDTIPINTPEMTEAGPVVPSSTSLVTSSAPRSASSTVATTTSISAVVGASSATSDARMQYLEDRISHLENALRNNTCRCSLGVYCRTSEFIPSAGCNGMPQPSDFSGLINVINRQQEWIHALVGHLGKRL